MEECEKCALLEKKVDIIIKTIVEIRDPLNQLMDLIADSVSDYRMNIKQLNIKIINALDVLIEETISE